MEIVFTCFTWLTVFVFVWMGYSLGLIVWAMLGGLFSSRKG